MATLLGTGMPSERTISEVRAVVSATNEARAAQSWKDYVRFLDEGLEFWLAPNWMGWP